MAPLLNLGILVSGRGSNMDAVIGACLKKSIAAKVGVVISNKPEAPALQKAKKASISTVLLEHIKGEPKEVYDQRLVAELNKYGVDLVILAGFMRLISPVLLKAFPNRVINIHPSLLPKFPGLHAQKQALDAKVSVSGCTVHFVDEGCDTGPIILQQTVPVLPHDTVQTLSERILAEEHKLLPKAIDLMATNKVKLHPNRQVIIES
ncbi:MAG TPA: phosphoribosylglycinamide formyltransferase [Deltaproteobacteria bacterium]|nr:MAG: phosphoribosylglycinamide formyltransferase [Deltaproteobacteria bacterium GWA2_45_12]HBF12412.1 phosphoribosylglycinamide formyltransferase [Deltaproteobacteria bacterium]